MLTWLPLAVSAQGTQLYLFKNGTAFTVKEQTVQANNNLSVIPGVPQALFGTYWAIGKGGAEDEIASIKAVPGNNGIGKKFTNLEEILLGNLGKRVMLILPYQDPVEAIPVRVTGGWATFKTKDKWITTTIAKIETIEFLDEPNTGSNSPSTDLEVTWRNAAPSHNLTTMYLSGETGWVPSYLVRDLDNGKVELTLKGQILHNGPAMKDATVHFVVGAPNFGIGKVKDPVADTTMSISKLLSNLQVSDAPNESQVYSNSYRGDANAITIRTESNLLPTSAEDLYLYTVRGVDLSENARSSFNILSMTLPAKDIYRVSLNLSSSEKQFLTYRSIVPTSDKVVYHSMEIQNSSSGPLTSGPALLMANTQDELIPLAQNTLTYAPSGGSTTIDISAVPDVQVSSKESETSRQNDLKAYKKVYDLITVDAQFTVKNTRNLPITLSATRDLDGEPLKTEGEWETTKQVRTYNPLVPNYKIKWSLDLKAGETRVVNYSYTLAIDK